MATDDGAQATQSLLREIESRWRRIFTTLAGGGDVPPSLRLRTEGMMEAALLSGAGEEVLDAAMDRIYRQSYGHPIATDFGPEWRAFHPFPQIPAMGMRAPVYPSTAE